MRKKLASLAMLFGMLTAVMLGSTSVAHAQIASTTTCTNSGVVNANVVYLCDVADVVTGDVITVVVKTEDVLSDNDIVILQNFLNGFSVQNILNDPDLVDADVLNNILNGSVVDVDILNDVNVCVALCGQQ